jgi:hypothetical protein
MSIMRYVVETDWQTEGQWIDLAAKPPYPEHPSDQFVRDAWTKCECVRVDLNGDGLAEIIVEVKFSPGATGNTSFHVVVQEDGQWRHAGALCGRDYRVQKGRTPTGYLDIVTSWNNGGGEYAVATYRYHKGRYREWQSHVEVLREGKEPLVRDRKEHSLR